MGKKYIATGSSAADGEFILPVQENGEWRLVGEKTKAPIEAATVVYVGTDITENDVFAKVVDAGFKIESVDRSLEKIRELLAFLKGVRIGKAITVSDGVFQETIT